MVFDWFRRSSAPQEPDPAALAEPVEPAGLPSDGAEPASEASPPTPTQEQEQPASAVPPPEPAQEPAAPAPAAVSPGIDQDALDWARQAYARLKAQQEAARGAAAPSAPTPAPSPVDTSAAGLGPAGPEAPAAPSPDSSVGALAGAPDTLAVAPAAASAASLEGAQTAGEAPPAVAASQQEPPAAPLQRPSSEPLDRLEPAPETATESPEPSEPLPAPSLGDSAEQLPTEGAAPQPSAAPGLSLLEQAAAARQERLRQLTATPLQASPAPAVDVPAPAPSPAPAAVSAAAVPEAEPSLGAFDDAFTWSAEVLAAQGRRVEDVSIEEIDWLTRLRRGLEKTRRGFVTQLLESLGDDPLSPEVLDDLETTLLRADVGVQATDLVLEALRRRLNEEVVDPAEGLRFLKEQLRGLLDAPTQRDGRTLLAPSKDRLNIWLLVGVNGVGKTTTLGKLANLAVRSGYSCLIAAADTFRAAAVEQVTVWGERSGVPVIANASPHADPAAVVYDAIGAAKARGTELVLVDTAGRLQTKHNLMEELAKVRRIVDRLAPEAAVESLLVLDASQGQNGLRQAMAFAPAAGLTGVVLTKLDGSARGGVAIAVAHDAALPIRFVGAGEGVRDLRPFNSFEFVEALLSG